MEVDHSKLYAECAEVAKHSTEVVPESRNRECEDIGEVEDVKYVNTQDYLDIGETSVSQWNRAAPEVATPLGFIKEEHIDPDDAELLAHTEMIKHLFNKKVEVSQDTYNSIKTEEQTNMGSNIISKAEDVAVDSITATVIKQEPCTSSEWETLKQQVASWRVILHRLPTDTLLHSTNISGGPGAILKNETNNNKLQAMEEVPHIEVPHNVTETEEVDKIGPTYLILKKVPVNDIRRNLANKQTEMDIPINETLFRVPDHEIYKLKKYICDHCQVKFNCKIKLQQHMSIHSSNSPTHHACPTCNYKCGTIRVLQKHSRLHDENRRFACNLCTYRFSNSKNLKNHALVHTGEMEYICMCGYTTSRLANLKKHLRAHTDERPFKCNTCDYASSRKDDLKRHLRIHSGEKSFKCDTCDYVCYFSSSLNKHMRTHTGEKSFKCDTCDYASSESSSLRKHIRTHTGERPFKCNFCDYASAESGTLKKHMRTHTGEKAFKCVTCDFATSQSSNLVSHMRIHTGNKPFKCDICDYAGYQLSNLKRHLSTHTRDKPFK